MVKVECSVRNCKYNKNGYCTKEVKKIQCLLDDCKYNKNGECTKKRIHIFFGVCADFHPKHDKYKDMKCKVVCWNTDCKYNYNGMCRHEEILISACGCQSYCLR